jgi:hypothetical protein
MSKFDKERDKCNKNKCTVMLFSNLCQANYIANARSLLHRKIPSENYTFAIYSSLSLPISCKITVQPVTRQKTKYNSLTNKHFFFFLHSLLNMQQTTLIRKFSSFQSCSLKNSAESFRHFIRRQLALTFPNKNNCLSSPLNFGKRS